jgi:hypothetical protein
MRSSAAIFTLLKSFNSLIGLERILSKPKPKNLEKFQDLFIQKLNLRPCDSGAAL